jgi:lactoylglutathione lyase
MSDVTVTHVGICVSDLDRARRFYIDALGFAEEQVVDIGEGFDGLLEVPGASIRAAFVAKDGIRLELLAYAKPAVEGSGEVRPMTRTGFTHLSCVVGDVDAVLARVRKAGGQVLEATRITTMGTMIFCTDPDGTRVELWQR